MDIEVRTVCVLQLLLKVQRLSLSVINWQAHPAKL